MSQQLVLVIDDEPDIRDLVREILEDEGYAVHVAENVATARESVAERTPDLVLLDIWMPDEDGVSLLKSWRDAGQLQFPVVMISGHATVETAVEATRLGAVDFIEKPLSLARLLLTVEKAMAGFKQQQAGGNIDAVQNNLPEIVGNSSYARELREQIEKTALDAETAVLIQGERATGKQLIAQHIHRASSRAGQPFVTLRCDSLSAASAERELLGNSNNAGYLESAGNGTLVLLDVDQLPNSAQLLLLSALQNGEFTREGGTTVRFGARLLATTSADLSRLINQNEFNEALYYRIAVLIINALPLREHREDVPALLSYYTDRLVEQQGLPFRHFTVAAQNRLRNFDWPGNVMELINLVQRLLILGKEVDIDLAEVDDLAGAQRNGADSLLPGDVMRLPLDLPLREARTEFEKLYLERQLERVDGNIVELARIVGMERTHLYRKLRSVGIQAGRKRG